MDLVMTEDGDCSLIYGCEVDEEHVEAAAPMVCLLWCAFCCDWLTGGSQEWGGIAVSEYYWRRESWIFLAVWGIGKLSGS